MRLPPPLQDPSPSAQVFEAHLGEQLLLALAAQLVRLDPGCGRGERGARRSVSGRARRSEAPFRRCLVAEDRWTISNILGEW